MNIREDPEMSFPDSKGSRNDSFQRHGTTNSNYDEPADLDNVNIPKSVLERRASNIPYGDKKGSKNIQVPSSLRLPNLVGSNTSSGSIHVISVQPALSWRKWLVGLYSFLYMGALITANATFQQYLYSRIQKEKFPNESLNDTSVCFSNQSDENYKKQTLVQQETASWQVYYSLAGGIIAIFSNAVLGSSTDKFGRKFLLFLPCVGTFVRLAIYCAGIYFNFKLEYFMIGNAVEGLTGQLFAMLLVCFTYVADVTPPKGKQRSFGIVMIELSIGISGAIFNFTSGFFIQNTGFFYPMLSSVGLITLSLLVVFLIPESFDKSKRHNGISLLANLRTIYDLFFGKFNRGRRWMYNTLMVVFTLTMFVVCGRLSVEPLYQLGPPFCWTPEKLGYFSTARQLLQQFLGMGLVKILQKYITDEAIAMMGCVSFAISFVVEGLATTEIILYIAPVVGAFGLLTVPMTRALMSKLTRADQQGAVFGSIAAMETAINVAGSLVANEIYSHTVNYYRGFVFFTFTFLNLVCLILMSVYRFGSRRTLPYVDIRRQ